MCGAGEVVLIMYGARPGQRRDVAKGRLCHVSPMSLARVSGMAKGVTKGMAKGVTRNRKRESGLFLFVHASDNGDTWYTRGGFLVTISALV